MTTTTIPKELLDFLKSVASESRMKILLLFMDGQERTVNQISHDFGTSGADEAQRAAAFSKIWKGGLLSP
jgi:predicted transcriptional regulator